MQKLSISVVFN